MGKKRKQQIAPYLEKLPSYFHPDLVRLHNTFKQEYRSESHKYYFGGDLQSYVLSVDTREVHYCIHYLAKKLFSSKHKLPSLDRESGLLVKPIAELYYQLFRVIRWVISASEPKYREQYEGNAYYLWGLILREKAFKGKFSPDGQDWTKTKLIKRWQRENRQLHSYDVNPFNLDLQPHSHQLVENCFVMATIQSESSEEFRKNYWMPMVKARMRIVDATKKSRNELWINGETLDVTLPGTKGKEKQPLKSMLENNPLKKVLSETLTERAF